MKSYHVICIADSLARLRQFSAESVDLVIADPPFNIGKRYRNYGDRLPDAQYFRWCGDWLNECVRLLRPSGSLFVFNYPENCARILPMLQDKAIFKRWITWHYATNTGHSRSNFTRSNTTILFAAKTRHHKWNRNEIAVPYRNPNDKRIKERIRNGSRGRTPDDVLEFNLVKNVSKDKTSHPCQVPVDLVKLLIKATTNRGDVVLDPFGGSGTTAVAAAQLERHSVSIDISPDYCRMSEGRLRRTASDASLLVEGGQVPSGEYCLSLHGARCAGIAAHCPRWGWPYPLTGSGRITRTPVIAHPFYRLYADEEHDSFQNGILAPVVIHQGLVLRGVKTILECFGQGRSAPVEVYRGDTSPTGLWKFAAA